MNEETTKEDFLQGQNDYVGWLNKLKAKLEEKGYMNEDGTITPNTADMIETMKEKLTTTSWEDSATPWPAAPASHQKLVPRY